MFKASNNHRSFKVRSTIHLRSGGKLIIFFCTAFSKKLLSNVVFLTGNCAEYDYFNPISCFSVKNFIGNYLPTRINQLTIKMKLLRQRFEDSSLGREKYIFESNNITFILTRVVRSCPRKLRGKIYLDYVDTGSGETWTGSRKDHQGL